jgi:lauroyl/myristoyl acyltransferase
MFHLRTDVPLIFSVSHKELDGTIVISFENINVESKSIEGITQDYTSKLEDKIRQYPDHYFWFHRKWSPIIENEKKNYK